MPNFAIHDGTTVLNVIVADSQEIAQKVTGLSAIETEGQPWIDWTKDGNSWRPPSPYASWTWNGTAWEAPVPMPPEGSWFWDEASLSWAETLAV